MKALYFSAAAAPALVKIGASSVPIKLHKTVHKMTEIVYQLAIDGNCFEIKF